MRKENVVNKNKCFPGRLLSGVSRLYSRLVNEETSLLYQQRISGRSRIKCGMTPLFDNAGFTLIELLVVVLIIGILAAVAVPQYQKAVDKAKYTQAMILGRKIAQAQQEYKLANGSYSGRFDELNIDMPTPISTRQDSEEMEYYFYNWGFCWISPTYDACLVKLNSSAQAWFFADRHPSSIPQFRFSCWAEPKNSTRANALCKAMTGKSTGRDNGYMAYDF